MPAFNSRIVGNTGTCSHFILCTCFSYVLLVLYSETYYSVFCSTLAHLLIELRYSVLNLNMPYSIFEKKKLGKKFLNFYTSRKKRWISSFAWQNSSNGRVFFFVGRKTYPNGLPFFNYKEKTISRIFPSFRCMIFSRLNISLKTSPFFCAPYTVIQTWKKY